RSAPRLSVRDRADPLVRPARFAHACEPRAGAARLLGLVPDPIDPSSSRTEPGISFVNDRPSLRRIGRTALPIVAAVVFAVVIGLTILPGQQAGTLGFDFLAYHQAAVRLLNGQPLYDMSFASAGGFGLFYYPPTFAPLILPFGLLSATAAVWVWTGLL